jgi:hypothetical protein
MIWLHPYSLLLATYVVYASTCTRRGERLGGGGGGGGEIEATASQRYKLQRHRQLTIIFLRP